jgi:hypothetical protein
MESITKYKVYFLYFLRNELEGIEGIVKMKTLDDSIVNINCDTNQFADLSKNLATNKQSSSSDLKLNGFEPKR